MPDPSLGLSDTSSEGSHYVKRRGLMSQSVCWLRGHDWHWIRDFHVAEGQANPPGHWRCVRCGREKRDA